MLSGKASFTTSSAEARHEDTRERTIHRLVEQYRIETTQANRVERTALAGLKQLKTLGTSKTPISGTCSPGHRDFTKSASPSRTAVTTATAPTSPPIRARRILTRRSDAFGSAHRRPPAEAHPDVVPRSDLDRGRDGTQTRDPSPYRSTPEPPPKPPPAASGRRGGYEEEPLYRVPPDWLDEHPLTHADLEAEAKLLKKIGYELVAS